MQNYSNHRKFYIPHHFIFYPVSLLMLGFSVYRYFADGNAFWLLFSGVIFLIIWLSFMLRQHYALGLQNRLILDEFRFRYFALSGKRLEQLDYKFTDAQIFSLRFSRDEDLEQMMTKTMANNWDADTIKKNIPVWNPDEKRV